MPVHNHSKTTPCAPGCSAWLGDVQPLPGMPEAPERPDMTPKVKEVVSFITAQNLTPEEVGQVLGALMLGVLGKVIKDSGL